MSQTKPPIPDAQSPSKVVAGALGLTGFTVAVVAGMGAGNEATTVITAAIISMFACHILGLFIGSAADRVLRDHVERYREAHPIAGHAANAQSVTTQVSSTSASELSTDAKKK